MIFKAQSHARVTLRSLFVTVSKLSFFSTAVSVPLPVGLFYVVSVIVKYSGLPPCVVDECYKNL